MDHFYWVLILTHTIIVHIHSCFIQVYNGHSGSLVGMTLCHNNQSLATISSSGAVLVVRVETATNKMSILQSRQLDLHEEVRSYLLELFMKLGRKYCELRLYLVDITLGPVTCSLLPL